MGKGTRKFGRQAKHARRGTSHRRICHRLRSRLTRTKNGFSPFHSRSFPCPIPHLQIQNITKRTHLSFSDKNLSINTLQQNRAISLPQKRTHFSRFLSTRYSLNSQPL
jgi:hypothetical protein